MELAVCPVGKGHLLRLIPMRRPGSEAGQVLRRSRDCKSIPFIAVQVKDEQRVPLSRTR